MFVGYFQVYGFQESGQWSRCLNGVWMTGSVSVDLALMVVGTDVRSSRTLLRSLQPSLITVTLRMMEYCHTSWTVSHETGQPIRAGPPLTANQELGTGDCGDVKCHSDRWTYDC